MRERERSRAQREGVEREREKSTLLRDGRKGEISRTERRSGERERGAHLFLCVHMSLGSSTSLHSNFKFEPSYLEIKSMAGT